LLPEGWGFPDSVRNRAVRASVEPFYSEESGSVKPFDSKPTAYSNVLEDLRAAVKRVGSRLVMTHLRPAPDRIPFTFRGSLLPLQEEAIQTLLSHDQGVLVAPPGTGKTVMGRYVAAARGLPTLVMVHRKPLLK
jgi:superfamily II DNA or RNA helicase